MRGKIELVTEMEPKVLLASDVQIQKGGGGGLLLYRLLTKYPSDKLLIVQPKNPQNFNKKIDNVNYVEIDYKIPRIIRNRYNPFWPIVMAKKIEFLSHTLQDYALNWKADCIFTVAHGFLWFASIKAAQNLGLPYHLVVHDHWPALITHRKDNFLSKIVSALCEKKMKVAYKNASTKFCVSPNMEKYYKKKFGVDGTVLYPTIGEDSPDLAKKTILPRTIKTIRFAYAGTIGHVGVGENLNSLGAELRNNGGCLDLYTFQNEISLNELGIKKENVNICGFLPSKYMGEAISNSADALVLPVSFLEREWLDNHLNFPSKLVDYLRIRIPVIFWCPKGSSLSDWAVRFGLEDCVEYTSNPSNVLIRCLALLNNTPAINKIVDKQYSIGNELFAQEKGFDILLDRIKNKLK